MNWMTSMCKCVCVRGREGGRIVTHQCHDFFCSMLEEFDREMEHTDSRMRSLTARVNKAIKKSGSKLYHDGDIAPLFVMLMIYFFPLLFLPCR